MKPTFLDTGYVLALEVSNDQNHQAAMEHWREWEVASRFLVTTSYVFDEIVTFFKRHGHHERAIRMGDMLLQSPSVELIHVDESLFTAGWDLLRHRPDKRYSLTDCVSFMVMERRGIETALTFDRHFRQAGFHTEP